MLFNSHFDDQVTFDMPFSFEPHSCSMIDALGEFDLFGCFACFESLPGASAARIIAGMPSSIAEHALSTHNHDALLDRHKTSSMARMALLGF